MSIVFVKDRLEVIGRILENPLSVTSGKFWTLEPKKIRFRYGESLAELKIPYHMGVEDEAVVGNAIKSLMELIKRRYEEGDKGKRGQTLEAAREGEGKVELRAETYRTEMLRDGTLEKDLAGLALRLSPLLDGALLSAWLVGDGPGKKLVDWVEAVMEKSLKDEATDDGEEPTAYLLLLVILSCIREQKEKIKDVRIKGLSYERLDITLSFTLYVVVKTAIWSLFDRLKKEGVHYMDEKTELVLKSALVPVSFLSIPSTLLSSSLNPYGISTDVFDGISKKAPKAEDISGGPEELLKLVAKAVKKDKALMEAMKAQYRVAALKKAIIDFLMDYDLPGHGVCKQLHDLYHEERQIRPFVTDPKQLDGFHKALSDDRDSMRMDRNRVEAIEKIITLVEGFKKGSGWFGGGGEEERALEGVLESYYAVSMDNHIEKYAGHMRVYMTDRRQEFDDKMLFQEYGLGRLYRFSYDKRPTLNTHAKEEEGQLFVDMKDFTKKTLKVKEAAMAEFMKENFYSPIIQVASRYSAGSGMYESDTGIRLNSLPGDAAIFSGGIASLVALADDILSVLRNYGTTLAKRLPPVKDEVLLDDVHKKFEETKAKIKAKRKEIEKAAHKNRAAADEMLKKLTEEEHRLENVYRSDLEEAIASEMEAGLFITYGGKAETIVLEASDDFGGKIKVAIGEKINEAARGTDRNSMVRAKLEMLLEKERMKRNNMKLVYPFDVYIDKTYNVRMPPEIDTAIEKVMGGKVDSIKPMAEVVASEFYQDLAVLAKGKSFASLRLLGSSNSIYNRGRAITTEAIEAYVKETKGTKFFFKKKVKTAELAEVIRNGFFFPKPVLDLWFGVEKQGGGESVEGFVKVSDIVFKGFEAAEPTRVHEMLDGNGEFFIMLMKHHFEGWHREAMDTAK